MKSKIYGYSCGRALYGFNPENKINYNSIYISNRVKEFKIYPRERKFETKYFKNTIVESIELCTYFTYLINGDVFQVESLFVPEERVDFISPLFKSLVLDQRNLFINRGQLIDNVIQNAERIKKKSREEAEMEITTFLASRPDFERAERAIKARDIFQVVGYLREDYIELIRVLASVLCFLRTDTYPLTSLKIADERAFKLCVELIEARENWSPKERLDSIIDEYVAEIERFTLDGDEEKFRFDSGNALLVLKKFDILSRNQ